MLTQINDIEKLPKRIVAENGDYFELLMYVTSWDKLFIGYSKKTDKGDNILCGVISSDVRREIKEYSDHVGYATSLEEAVNMLYDYISNNPEIKVEQ